MRNNIGVDLFSNSEGFSASPLLFPISGLPLPFLTRFSFFRPFCPLKLAGESGEAL